MPALAVTQPNYPRFDDLKQGDSPVDRQLESALVSATNVQSVLLGLLTNSATGAAMAANTVLRPTHVVSGGGITAYEADLADALVKIGAVVADLKDAAFTQV